MILVYIYIYIDCSIVLPYRWLPSYDLIKKSDTFTKEDEIDKSLYKNTIRWMVVIILSDNQRHGN